MKNEFNFSFLVHSTHTYLPMKMEQSVPKRRHINSRRRGITQKKAYNVQNTAKASNQEDYTAVRIFSDIFPSDRTMALESTQPLVKMSTRNTSWGWRGPVRLKTSPHSCAECYGIWEHKPPGTLWATPGLLRDCFTFTFTVGRMRFKKSL